MIKKICVYWRDIPSQVIVQRGRQREKSMLSARFQEAIDRAAMRAGKGSSDAYIAEWRRETARCDAEGDLRQIALLEASRLESEFSDDRLNALIRNHGSADGV
jgi:hypothetical protein